MPNQYSPVRSIEIPIGPSIAYVPLTQGLYALIDREDAPLLGQWNWCVLRGRIGPIYAIRFTAGRVIFMHRLLCGTESGLLIDHRNGNGLHNHKNNLRSATVSNNAHNRPKSIKNTSGYKGVCFSKRYHFWVAQIAVQGKYKWLGHFSSAEDAHLAYCRAAAELHGDFSRTQ